VAEAPAQVQTPAADPVDVTDFADAGQAEAPPESRRPRRDWPPFLTKKVTTGVGGILGVAAIWWMITVGFGGGADVPDTGIAAATPAAVPATPVTPPAAAFFDAPAGRAAFDVAPELGHSVMIASFTVAADANERLRQLRSADGGFYFVSPTPVRGIVYHRVFAGALASRGEARTLMDALVASGVKGEAGAWHLRPATLAFDLGVYSDRAAADRRIEELTASAIPAYALTATGEVGQVWRVYGGAYVNDNESVPMAQLLFEAGESVELITRRGTIP
jgi:cell division septation protein DedD